MNCCASAGKSTPHPALSSIEKERGPGGGIGTNAFPDTSGSSLVLHLLM